MCILGAKKLSSARISHRAKKRHHEKNLPYPYLGYRVHGPVCQFKKKKSIFVGDFFKIKLLQIIWKSIFTLSFWCQSLSSNRLQKNSQPACLQIISWLQRDQVCNLLVREPYSNIGYSCDGPKFLFRAGCTKICVHCILQNFHIRYFNVLCLMMFSLLLINWRLRKWFSCSKTCFCTHTWFQNRIRLHSFFSLKEFCIKKPLKDKNFSPQGWSWFQTLN